MRGGNDIGSAGVAGPKMVVSLALDFLRMGRPVQFEVTGQSMFPFLRAHDLVEVHPWKEEQLCVGQVIVLSGRENHLLIHRVIRLEGGKLMTRGDASAVEDGWLSSDLLVGRVLRTRRGSRSSRLGLGWEGRFLALFSRYGLLFALCRMAAARSRQNDPQIGS